jgi:hypothetical protein
MFQGLVFLFNDFLVPVLTCEPSAGLGAHDLRLEARKIKHYGGTSLGPGLILGVLAFDVQLGKQTCFEEATLWFLRLLK